MEGSGKDHTVDSFVSQDDAMDPDLPDTPRLTKYLRFHPKIKGKAKVGSSRDPPVEAVAIHGAKPSTVLSGTGLRSDGTEQEVGDSTEVDDRDDIVREISVFCGSGNLGEDTQLYVMQQVLREAWRPYELNNRCEEIRLDPNQLKIEVDLRFERDDGNSDQEISKPLNLQKQTLSSTVVSSSVQYAVGFLEKNKFHLNPVHAVLQLRPSFASLHDDFIKKTFVSETAEASTKAIKPWILLQYHPIDSSVSNKNRHNMAASGVGNVQFMMRPSDYLNFLPSRKLADETVRGSPSMWHGLKAFHRMKLGERLKTWFHERSQVNSFDDLKHLAEGFSEDELLEALLSYANLVQGLWVCKSSLLYDGAEAMQRDYILLLFSRMDTIQHHELRKINFNPSVFKCMMGALAYERKLLGDWKFKQSTDLSFIRRYPNIVREQENAWLDIERIIMSTTTTDSAGQSS